MKLIYIIICLVIILGVVLAFRAFVVKKDAGSNEWPPEILKQANDNRTAREAVKLQYPELFSEMQKCLFEHDPIAINFETNTDEYNPDRKSVV